MSLGSEQIDHQHNYPEEGVGAHPPAPSGKFRTSEAMMTFEEFCTRNRLRIKTDVDGTLIVAGKLGHIYEYGPGEFAVMLLLNSRRAFSFARNRLLAAGCTSRQRGDAGGSASFSPENELAVIQAIREAKIARIPRRTALQLATLREKGSRFRFRPAQSQAMPDGPAKPPTQLDKANRGYANRNTEVSD